MIPTLLAVRETDRTTLLRYGLDLNDLLHEEIFLVISHIETAFDNKMYEVFGYDYAPEEVLSHAWVRTLRHSFDTIIDHLKVDNAATEEFTVELWIHGNNEVKLTLNSGEIIIGRMAEFNDEDPEHAWLTFHINEHTDDKIIAFNDIQNIVSVRQSNISNKEKIFSHWSIISSVIKKKTHP